MRAYPYVTLDVFTARRFGGNPLAVITDARGLSDGEMQALAAEFNYSETTFVLPPSDPAHTARVRIFHRTAEMPFAGHPNLGTAFVLAGAGLDRNGVVLFEELAGLVEVRIHRGPEGPRDGVVRAPQPLTTGIEMPRNEVAACIGLSASELILDTHPPLVASVGVAFVLVEVEAAALARAAPDLPAFRALRDRTPGTDRHSILLYARGNAGHLRARMFAPLSGTWEDPATGSANATLAALLVSLGNDGDGAWRVTQGDEIGRPSVLAISAQRGPDGVRASVGGPCVEIARGWVSL